MSDRREGKVILVRPGRVVVDLGSETVSAFVRGGLKIGPRQSRHVLAVGDDVILDLERGEPVIEEVLPRRNRVSRVAPGDPKAPVEHVLAANLDWLVVVLSLELPRFNPRVADRLLVLAEISNVPPLMVFNKSDRSEEEDPTPLYRAIGYPVLRTSAWTGEGLDSLRDALTGKVSLLAGPSGVGKSSLLNALRPGTERAVSAVSKATGKGVHATTAAHWFSLPGGGGIIDSPGIRGIQPWGLTPRSLPGCFPEFRDLPACQFRDCFHREEPGCQVRAAVEAGSIAFSRYESYRRLLDDASGTATS